MKQLRRFFGNFLTVFVVNKRRAKHIKRVVDNTAVRFAKQIKMG